MNQSKNPGILPDFEIQELRQSGALTADAEFDADQVQPASIDLRLGARAWRVRASFLPGSGRTVEDRLRDLSLHSIDLTDGAVFETGCVYIVMLRERLNLPFDVRASANPKSSTGRIDVFTRVITDESRAFDQVPAGYVGPLYAEISPRTFPVLARAGSRLSQIRFRRGGTILSDGELADLHRNEMLVAADNPVFSGGVPLSIDLKGGENGGLVGFRAKRHTSLIDIDAKLACDPREFWEPIDTSTGTALILDPNEFYILVSNEAVHIPPTCAAEMVPFDPLVGEFRVHYAGFFDPGFGNPVSGGSGARAVLEVRSHEVPFIVEHGQTVGRLVYEHMAARPNSIYGQDIGSNYQGQALKLSKHFKPWRSRSARKAW